MSALRPSIVAARAQLADGMAEIRREHEAGRAGLATARAISQLREEVLCRLWVEACAAVVPGCDDGCPRGAALVAHGGTGRGDVSPHSDVDLMLLYDPSFAAHVAELAQNLVRDVFDAGLTLGHSARTIEQACRLAREEPEIATSLMESRLLAGDTGLFERYRKTFRGSVRRQRRKLLAAVAKSRTDECLRYGETVYLLEPNVKRSRGGLRDVQWARWIGFIRHGLSELGELVKQEALSPRDAEIMAEAHEFLLWLRHELHFSAETSADVLTRAQQLRIAAVRGYQDKPGLLAVEQFMQSYFRHTQAIADVTERLSARAVSHPYWAHVATVLFGHWVEPGMRIGPVGVRVDRRGARRLQSDWDAIVRLGELANLYHTQLAPDTVEAIRRALPQLGERPSAAARRRFLSLLGHPGRLGPVLRELHDAGILERFVPGMERARGLLQFNQYHKYTVDEHCLRAVENAVALLDDPGPLGRVYRGLSGKWLLHLALLMHDLGKGRLEDHRVVGVELARQAAADFALGEDDAQTLIFLIQKHQMLTHEAFHRDSEDEETIVRLAVQTGSPKRLELLYVMTACDLGAVGPNVWDGWKYDVVTRLFHRTMQYLAAESPATTNAEFYAQRRAEIAAALGPDGADPWFARQVAALPPAYLHATDAACAADDLRLLRGRDGQPAAAAARYHNETEMLELTIGTSEAVAGGIFHRLTGVLTGCGLEIRAAQIHTFGDQQILDRFWVRDPDYQGPPPEHRIAEICRGLVEAVSPGPPRPPQFRKLWQSRAATGLPPAPPRVNIDNTTSNRYTIFDVFAADRAGLLYDIARTLFECELSVWRARIATYQVQVVDVFYVTDPDGEKCRDAAKFEAARRRLLEVLISSDAPGESPPAAPGDQR